MAENMCPQCGQMGKHPNPTMNQVMREASKKVSITPEKETAKEDRAEMGKEEY